MKTTVGKNYYVHMNYCNPVTQCKKSIILIRHKEKPYIKSNINGTLK